MRETKSSGHLDGRRLAVNTEDLALMLGCGKSTAVKVGEKAGAKLKIGKRVLWSIPRVELYLETICGNEGACVE